MQLQHWETEMLCRIKIATLGNRDVMLYKKFLSNMHRATGRVSQFFLSRTTYTCNLETHRTGWGRPLATAHCMPMPRDGTDYMYMHGY